MHVARLLRPEFSNLSNLASEFLRQLSADTPRSVDVLRILGQLERDVNLSALVRATNDGVLVDGALVSRSEASAALAQGLAAVSEVPRENRLAAVAQYFIAQTKDGTKRPVIVVLLTVIGAILMMILEGEVQYYSGELLQPVRQYVIRQVKGKLQNATPAQSEIRLVRVKQLAVRTAPHQKHSTVITRVSFPTLVVVLRERKDWTLITYEEGDAVVQGWVFTRYLTKLSTPKARRSRSARSESPAMPGSHETEIRSSGP